MPGQEFDMVFGDDKNCSEQKVEQINPFCFYVHDN